jgi:hypothetical protein
VPFKGRGRRQGAGVFNIKFLKNEQASITHMPCQFLDSIDRIRVVHKDESAYDRVKQPIKLHFCRVAFQEFHILKMSRLYSRPCSLHRCSGPIDTNDLSAWPYEAGGQKRHVSTAATHVKNAHARAEPGLLQ